MEPGALAPRRSRSASAAALLAALASLLGTAALAVEAHASFTQSLAAGRGLALATFLYLRYFTITTNVALVVLQAITAARLLRGRRLPSGAVYDACLVYAAVTGVTYEALLRSTWSPHGAMFLADLVLHDVAPLLTLAVWLLAAPRTGVGWRDPFVTLVYPAAYLAVTLVAGAAGAGYPYPFLDAARLGLADVLLVSTGFLAAFLGLGFAVAAAAKALGRSARGLVPPTTAA